MQLPDYAATEPDAEAYGLAPGSEMFGDGQAADPGRLDPSLEPGSDAPPAAPEPADPLTDRWLEQATEKAPQQ